MSEIANPEDEWERADRRRVTLTEIQGRIGPIEETPTLLPGTNLNLRVCPSKVLRISSRGSQTVGREAACLRKGWQSFRVPKVIVRGTDYILMENVHHQALQDGPHQGHAVGRALAEIHSVRFRAAGTIDGDLELDRQEPDPIAAMGARVPNGHSWTELRQAVASHLERHRQSLGPLIGRAVLLHGDFGVANLHQALDGVLVLDWELCRAGPALCDVGRLLRWGASQSFIEGFAQAYRAFGGELPDDFVTAAQLLDLVSLVEALEGAVAGSRRATDLQARIGQTLA